MRVDVRRRPTPRWSKSAIDPKFHHRGQMHLEDYHLPLSVDEAVGYWRGYAAKARVANGTDLILDLQGNEHPDALCRCHTHRRTE
jgi:hypothetical protein